MARTCNRMRLLLSPAVICLLLLGGALSPAQARERRGPVHENKRWGYKLRAPKNWKRAAIHVDEQWIADKFFPPYELVARGEGQEPVRHKPDLWVIGFPKERKKERVEKEVAPNVHMITVKNPYSGYKEFVKRESWATSGQGGWYYAREDSLERDGAKIDVFEIKVEKLVLAPTRVITWVYHLDDVSFAVQVRILEAHVNDNRTVLERCLKSFEPIPRTEPFPQAGEDDVEIELDEDTTTPEERHAARLDAIEARIDRHLKHLPDGWRVQRSKHFIALTQQDKRHTGYVLNFAEDVRTYLDKHFKSVGPARLPPGLLRVFVRSDDQRAYEQGTRSWWAHEVAEIPMTFGLGADILSQFSWLAGRIVDQYFYVKNPNLWRSMPTWLQTGIRGHISWARPSKRRRMVLQPTPSNVLTLRPLIAQGNALPVRDLMHKASDAWNHEQAASVVYFLLHQGNKGKTKGGLATYIGSLESIIAEENEIYEQAEAARMKKEAEAAAEKAEADKGKSDEELEREEEEAFIERKARMKEFSSRLDSKFEAIRARALLAAFGELSVKQWDSLDRRWRKFAMKGK